MGIYTLNIVGESYRQDAIKLCHEGESIILKREPNNQYDPNAVAVLREDGSQIGYLSKFDAEWVSRIIDRGTKVLARIKYIRGGTPDKPSLGVLIEINTTPSRGWESGESEKKYETITYTPASSLTGKQQKEHAITKELPKKGFWKRIFGK